MKFEITPQAAQWYVKELRLKEGESLKFFGKVYGTRDGFSFAIAKEEPTNPFKLVTIDGVNFYIEKTDAWFFEDINLTVDFDTKLNEPFFTYENKPEANQ